MAAEKRNVVCIEDEPEMIDLIRLILGRKGFELTGAMGGREGPEAIRRVRPDLVLLDLRLPVIDGLEVCKKVKADEKLKDIPIILFTASMNSIIDRVKEVGADGYLIKPFNQEQLAAVLKKFLDKEKE